MSQIKKQKTKFQFNPTIFLIIFVIIPGILIWFFLGRDVNKTGLIPFWALLTITISHSTLVLVATILLIYLKVMPISGLNLVAPMTIILTTITLTYELNSIIRFVIVIIMVIVITMTMMFLTDKSKKQTKK